MDPINLSGPNLANASAIKANGEKLLEDQRYRSELEHHLQSDYLAYRRLVGTEIADRFVIDLVKIAF